MHGAERFNCMADYYDLHRPGYPDAAIDTILHAGAFTASSCILEVGAGSGKATRAFLERGLSLTCLEPGAELVHRGQAQSQGAEFIVTRFEDFDSTPHAWDGIISAQAFHWIAQPAGYRQRARLLRPGGTLALMWNLDLFSGSEDDQALWAVLDRYNGFVSCMRQEDYPARQDRISGEMSRMFSVPEVLHFSQEIRYTPESYYHYLLTSQVFFAQDEAIRAACCEALHTLAAQHPQALCRRYTCEVYLAHAAR